MVVVATPWKPLRAQRQLPAAAELEGPFGGSPATALTAGTHRHFQALMNDRPPESYLERLALHEVARNASALDLVEACETSVVRIAEQSAALVAAGTVRETDVLRVAALKGPAMTHLLHYRAVHQRGLHAAIRGLLHVSKSPPEIALLPEVIRTDSACTQYLRKWQQQRPWECPSCRGVERYWLEGREVWECQCGQQYSIRQDTLFAGSHTALLVWFQIIAAVIIRPTATARQLTQQVGCRRSQTVGLLMTKIKHALASEAASTLLAGVDRLLLANLYQANEPDVSIDP